MSTFDSKPNLSAVATLTVEVKNSEQSSPFFLERCGQICFHMILLAFARSGKFSRRIKTRWKQGCVANNISKL